MWFDARQFLPSITMTVKVNKTNTDRYEADKDENVTSEPLKKE